MYIDDIAASDKHKVYTRRLLDLYFSCDAPPQDVVDQVLCWLLLDPRNAEEKDAALYEQFEKIFEQTPAEPSEESRRQFEKLKKKLGSPDN